MKKLILSLVFTGTFMFANAGSTIFYNCHAYACSQLGSVEQALAAEGISLTASEAESVYQMYYAGCADQ